MHENEHSFLLQEKIESVISGSNAEYTEFAVSFDSEDNLGEGREFS